MARKAAELPAYSGPNATCPKCKAGTPVLTIYHYAGGVLAPKLPGGVNPPCRWASPNDEHLCRVCKNCGYGWPEACADGSDDQRPDLTVVQNIGEPGVGPGVSHARRHS
jgi:hypothetical protein